MSDDLVKQTIKELQDIVHCDCAPAYLDRGLHSHVCLHYMADALKIVADRIEELEAVIDRQHKRAETLAEGWRIADDARIELEAKLTQAVADRDREKAYADLAAINLDRAIAARRDALEARADRIEELEAKLAQAVAALAFYSCEDGYGCNECPESERARVSCGWNAHVALATLAELTGGKDE